MNEEELAGKIKSVLERSVRGEMTQDSITAVISLETQIIYNKALVKLILEGMVEAEYTNKDDNRLDLDGYVFRKVDNEKGNRQ